MTSTNLDQKPYLIATAEVAQKFDLHPTNGFHAKYFHHGELDVRVNSPPQLHNANPHTGNNLVAVIQAHPNSKITKPINQITIYAVEDEKYQQIVETYGINK
mgnify:FL=1